MADDAALAKRLGAAAVGLVLAVAIRGWTLSTGEPLGTDGYYYLVQIQDLVATGSLHVPDGSWTLRVLALPHALGVEPILGLALASVVLACLPAAVALVGRRPVLSLLLAISPTLTHLAADFPKSLGLAAPWVVAALALQASLHDRRWLLLAAPALAAAATAHRLGTVFALLTVVGAGVAAVIDRTEDPRRAVGWLAAGLAATTVLSGVFLAASSVVPGLLHPDDLARISALGTSMVPPPWSWWSARPDTSSAQLVELILAYAALGAAIFTWRRDPVLTGAAVLPLLACLAPIYPPDTLDLGYRVHLFAPLFAAPLLAGALPRPSSAVGLLLLLLPASAQGPTASTTPPYALYRALIDDIPEPYPELLIAHQGMNFLYDYRTGHEAMAWAPDPGMPLEHVGRVAYGILPGEWLQAHAEGDPDIVYLGHGYHYVGEITWQRLVRRAQGSDLEDRIADWRNPTSTRPAYLLRRRASATADGPSDR